MSLDDDVSALAQAIADGQPIDWSAKIAATPREGRPMLEALWHIASMTAEPDWACDHEETPAGRVRQWGPFELKEELGRGAYGIVYKARDPRLDRDVALKVLTDSEGGPDSGFVEEGRLLARLRHPNIVCVYGAERHEGHDGLWMELIHGRTFHEIIQVDGPLSAREATLVGVDLCLALMAVHAAGVAHRDITGRNVMRERGGRVVLLDFSAGRRWSTDTSAVQVAGTPLYLAPEVLLESAEPSVATDIYSVGVFLFFLVTGAYPVNASTLSALRQAHASRERQSLSTIRPDLPPAFVTVVERALSWTPEDRPGSAAEMSRELLSAIGSALPADRVTNGNNEPSGLLSRPVPAWAVVLLTVIAAAVVWLTPRVGTRQEISAARTISESEWPVLMGYLDLADEAGNRLAWDEAATLYERAARLLSDSVGDDEPIRAHVLASRAFALTAAGRFREAHEWQDLAIYKLAQEAGRHHPLLITAELSKAHTFRSEDNLDEARSALWRALDLHRRMLTDIGIDTRQDRLDLPLESIAQGVCDDADGDWVLDVFERSVGLDPSRSDSNGDGVPDGEEDSRGDGVTNAVAWPYGCDPRRVIAHHGAVDPLRLGFRQERRFPGTPVDDRTIGAAWRVDSPMGFYYVKLTDAQKQDAMSRGWRSRGRLALRDGVGFVNVDLVPHAGRFDLGFFAKPGGTASLLLTEWSLPRSGEWFDQGPLGPMPLVEHVFDPASRTSSLLINGRTVRRGHQGYRQYQEDFGLFFGTNNDMGAARGGSADFSLAWLVIR